MRLPLRSLFLSQHVHEKGREDLRIGASMGRGPAAPRDAAPEFTQLPMFAFALVHGPLPKVPALPYLGTTCRRFLAVSRFMTHHGAAVLELLAPGGSLRPAEAARVFRALPSGQMATLPPRKQNTGGPAHRSDDSRFATFLRRGGAAPCGCCPSGAKPWLRARAVIFRFARESDPARNTKPDAGDPARPARRERSSWLPAAIRSRARDPRLARPGPRRVD